nr:hypothetical protein CFP56_39883 [Quercus suber]
MSKPVLSTPSPSDTSAQTSGWRRIWALNVPNKIKHFLWRACRDSLPTKKNLLARNVTKNALCEWCNEEVEDSVHALWGCQALKEVWWEEEILRNHLSMRFVDFRDLWIGITNLDAPNLAEQFAFAAWSIWNKRNAARMHASSIPFHLLYQDMRERLLEYRSAQEPPIPEFRPAATFMHVKRQGNAVADKLAKAAKTIPCPHVWSNDIPSDVQQLVIHDCIL